QRWSLYRCVTCDRTFSERTGTPFFRLQIDEAKVLEALERLSQKQSIRTVADALDVDKNTVLNVLKLAVRQPRWFQVSLPRDYNWDARRTEHLYAFIHERKRQAMTRTRLAGKRGRAS
ncbi:MAG TPA: hypothetical protein VI818_05790, partial [Candidatus Thermoplasmatota archaeon]|nr:hypothetical protein [Candidatus Thermoplasmatota archaeon]